jgi:cytochrome P450
MTGPYLARMVPRMTESIMEMIELWTLSSERLRKQGSTERAFSAMDDIRLSAIDVIASITFGTSFNSIRAAIDLLDSDPQLGASIRPPTPALAHALEQLLETIGRNALFPVPSLLTIWTRTFDREWNRARRLLYSFLEAKLDKAREAFESSGQNELKPEARSADNVLDMILEKEKEDHLKGEKALSKSEILDELATYALGGSESAFLIIVFSVLS